MTDWTKLRKDLIGEGKKSPLPSEIKLPMLPKAVMEFSRKAEDPNTTPKELSKIIETDAGISCELLRMVNSSALGLRRKVSSIQQTITLLGIRSTKLFLVTTGLKQAMSTSDSKLINLPNFWSTNLERALMAREIALLMKVDPDVAFSAAMLQDFLLPILSRELFDQYLQFTVSQDSTPCILSSYELEHFSWNHCEAAAHVMLDWSFPDDLICSVYLHHEGLKILTDDKLGRTPAAAVAVARGGARHGIGDHCRQWLPVPCPLRHLAVRLRQTAAWRTETSRHGQRILSATGVAAPADRHSRAGNPGADAAGTVAQPQAALFQRDRVPVAAVTG